MPDENTFLLARCMWDEATKRRIEMQELRPFGVARNIFKAKLPAGKTITFQGIPAAQYESECVSWISDKSRLKKELVKLGMPVAKGGAVRTKDEAAALFRALVPPVIVKPHQGSGSRHTILHIKTENELSLAFIIAKQVSPMVVIEEELVGSVYRATLVGGKLIAVLRRDPPQVMGDGVHTIFELIEEENKHPARSGPYFAKIQLDERAREELARQEYEMDSVPLEEARVSLHQKVHWSAGGTSVDVTDEVHPDNVTIFEQIARELRAPVVGIDFIISDIRRSWKEEKRCGILECNSMPFIDKHHFPFEGKPRNVAGAIWDMVMTHYI
ncbi:hypothetical protein H0X32_03375 [Patescibacteria group bacterium]|nr:hypothetical protein [Patescibacteria group bacterium]